MIGMGNRRQIDGQALLLRQFEIAVRAARATVILKDKQPEFATDARSIIGRPDDHIRKVLGELTAL